jgi:hypothetical protein
MKTPDAAAATGEQMALRAGFCVSGALETQKKAASASAGARVRHTQKPNGRNKSCKFDFGS